MELLRSSGPNIYSTNTLLPKRGQKDRIPNPGSDTRHSDTQSDASNTLHQTHSMTWNIHTHTRVSPFIPEIHNTVESEVFMTS